MQKNTNEYQLHVTVHRIMTTVLDALFPTVCGVCGAHGDILCDRCFRTLPKKIVQTCGACGGPETVDGNICPLCVGTVAHDGIFAAGHYDDPALAHLIHLFKYRFIEGLGVRLGTFLSDAVTQSGLPLPDAIVPIPLHARRKRWRGWNQSELLAKALIANLPAEGAPLILDTIVTRSRFTPPQKSLARRELRAQNIAGAFKLIETTKQRLSLKGARIWLIDDVAASGATIHACADVLKKNGAAEVYGIVVAR